MEALILSLLLGPFSHAEYRAYRLNITNTNTGASRIVLSNFDNIQYRDLYPVLAEEVITIESSWMCRGDTSQKPICPETENQPQTLPKSDLN